MIHYKEDLKPGEEIISSQQILDLSDPIFDPTTRPSLEEAIAMIIGKQGGYEIPFASVTLKRHNEMANQNLFRCLFGRDALLIADLLSVHRPELLRNVVLALGAVQGKNEVDASEEEFGRIAHEVREVDDPRALEIMREGNWLFPYYGAVDATLIWVKAVSTIVGKEPTFLDFVVNGESIGDRVIDASTWMLRRLNSQSGLIESYRKNPQGIENQVWKDSGDSYMHKDGTLALQNTCSSIETVAETYDALITLSYLVGKFPSERWPMTSEGFQAEAKRVQRKLLDSFWLGDRFALAIARNEKGEQVPLDSQASNQGRLLDSAILDGDEYALYRKAIAQAITHPRLLGDSGLRSLASDHVSYRPGGYQTGSAWPMDGVFAARGLLRYGFTQEAHEIMSRLIKTIEAFGGYPEYFRGDYPLHTIITTSIIDASWLPSSQRAGYNRVAQPPQLIQGWTVGAYAWLSIHGRTGHAN
ncbi:MAG: hypothetical protein WCL26_05555 [Actinomycetes bacterium]|jgi:hypothetical protein